jgi:hypothetical protein
VLVERPLIATLATDSARWQNAQARSVSTDMMVKRPGAVG